MTNGFHTACRPNPGFAVMPEIRDNSQIAAHRIGSIQRTKMSISLITKGDATLSSEI
jgi:hypothetical protein